MKWFKKCEKKKLLELVGKAMTYVIIEDSLLEELRMKWEDAKLSELEYYIANVGPNTR